MSSQNEHFVFKTSQGVSVLSLCLPEELDSSEFDQLNENVLKGVQEQSYTLLIVDLTGVTYAGSSILGLLVNIRQQVRARGARLVLCGVGERLTHIFHACSLERLFKVYPTLDEARRH